MRNGNKARILILILVALSPLRGWSPPFGLNRPPPCECQKEGYPQSTCTTGCGNLPAASFYAGITDSGCHNWAGVTISAACCTGTVPNNAPGCPSSTSILSTTTQQIINTAVPPAMTSATTEFTIANSLAGQNGAVSPSPIPIPSSSP